MINSFENYLKLGKAKKKTPDPEESEALLEKSENRLQYTKGKLITEGNSQFVLEDAYEAIRESAQALMSIKGYKPYSHEATISFVKDFYKSDFNEQELNKFDRFRKLRNNSVYKAVPVSIADAEGAVAFASDFINKIKNLLGKKSTNVLRETFGTMKFKKSTQEIIDELDDEENQDN